MRSLIISALLILIISSSVIAQEKKSPKLAIPESLKPIVPYGTFEYAFGGNKNG